jgi:hypothetical protein
MKIKDYQNEGNDRRKVTEMYLRIMKYEIVVFPGNIKLCSHSKHA